MEINMAEIMRPYDWQLYVMLALCVLIGVIVGMLIADGRKPSGKALIRPDRTCCIPIPRDGGRFLIADQDQPLETIEVDGHTLYVLHRGGNASAGRL